ncbi:hypothetical protein CXQ85_002016 [Candidozyma haemuli]|uniref:Uncharacterized protein n=1 Tax=Candidozyma haemuli TaxID=45357 RepID=A0A2V1AR67_9ASCO|nr:hypothetical protein CXQ85_002016 [[Candida] haemuloni]PVH20232.1 hypothetical protein CXQ85_002016 [[Candida] haemuloni]
MFGSPTFTIDTYNEWEGVNRARPVHLDTDSRQGNLSHSRRNGGHSIHSRKDIPSAPPLASYLPNAPGPSAFHEEYMMGGQGGRISGQNASSVLTPSMAMKLDKLRSIRATGYYTLAPIGINKTMAQLDYEAQEMEDEDCNVAQAENSNANVSTSIYQDAPSGMPDASAEQDLDADIEDADASGSFQASSDLSEDEANIVGQSDLRDAGPVSHDSMTDTQVISAGLGRSGPVTISTEDTSETSAPLPNCEASDVDMVIEDD